MGGVIASYLAAMVPVKKLVLLAPAFSYINMDMITDAITKSAISLWTNDKKEEIQLPRSFYSAFSELIKNLKKYITKVDCPILFLHGDEDEVISIKSSINAVSYTHLDVYKRQVSYSSTCFCCSASEKEYGNNDPL